MPFYRWTTLLFLSCVLYSCSPGEARPSRKQRIVLATDCLTKEDERLFKSFKKYHHIDVQIVQLSADSILYILKNAGVNTEIDAVLLRYSRGSEDIERNHTLKSKVKSLVPSSQSLDYFTVGQDPYVIFQSLRDSSNRQHDLTDLMRNTPWTTDLSISSDFNPLFSGVKARMKDKKKYSFYDWKKDFLKNNAASTRFADSAGRARCLLTLHSHFAQQPDLLDHYAVSETPLFINQQNGGSYYQPIRFGIVRHARNFSNAKELLDYLFNVPFNRRLNNRLGTFPVVERGKSPYPYQNEGPKMFAWMERALRKFPI
jgi:hypothetical protein